MNDSDRQILLSRAQLLSTVKDFHTGIDRRQIEGKESDHNQLNNNNTNKDQIAIGKKSPQPPRLIAQMFMPRTQSTLCFFFGVLTMIAESPKIHPKHKDRPAVPWFGVVQAEAVEDQPKPVGGVDYVDLCACPVLSACPGNCGRFTVNDDTCQVFYQCFLEVNGLFGYVKVTRTVDDGEEDIVRVLIYDTNDCSGPPRFSDPTAVGFEGSCADDCWGDTTSKIGAGSCGTNPPDPQPTDPPSSSSNSGLSSSPAATISVATAAAMVAVIGQ